jgi:hypothetical protein
MPDFRIKLTKVVSHEVEIEIPDCENEDVADAIASSIVNDLDNGNPPKLDDTPLKLNWEEEATIYEHEETWEE